MNDAEGLRYRAALGAYVTGVTVVTAPLASGGLGITVNSFHSISLNPRLVGWWVDEASERYESFVAAEMFGVSVLADDQQELAARFATEAVIAGDDAAFEAHAGGALLARNAVARFACRTWARHEAGDHMLMIGEVVDFDAPREAASLTYHRSSYGSSRPTSDTA